MSDTKNWTLACGDVMPGCAAVFTGPTQDAVLEQAAPHAASEHDLTEIDEATRAAVVGAMTQG